MLFITKRRRQTAITVGLLGLMLLLGVVVASPALATTEGVPLKGTFSGVGANFSGYLTLLGYFQGVIDNTVVPPTAVWTAANGDTITNQTTSFVIDFSAPLGPDVYPYTQSLVVTGGSGRFSQASGSAEVTGTINVVTFAYDGRLEGTLSLPGQ